MPVIRWLKALNIPFLMPAIIRGKTGGTRQLLVGRKSYATRYNLQSGQYGTVCCQMRVVCTYHKGFKGKHGIQYSLYVVHRVKIALNQLHQHYKHRFGIETSYRLKNHCRIRTTTKNPVTRLLFVALAFILVNLWVYLLWCFVSRTRRGGRVVYRELFCLKTMLEFLKQAVERHFPVITPCYHFRLLTCIPMNLRSTETSLPSFQAGYSLSSYKEVLDLNQVASRELGTIQHSDFCCGLQANVSSNWKPAIDTIMADLNPSLGENSADSQTGQTSITFPADSGVIDITQNSYGAIPNDEQDDTAAIQKALNEAANSNRIIYIPDGIYLVSDRLD